MTSIERNGVDFPIKTTYTHTHTERNEWLAQQKNMNQTEREKWICPSNSSAFNIRHKYKNWFSIEYFA